MGADIATVIVLHIVWFSKVVLINLLFLVRSELEMT